MRSQVSKFKMQVRRSLCYVHVYNDDSYDVRLAGDYMKVTNRLSEIEQRSVAKAISKYVGVA